MELILAPIFNFLVVVFILWYFGRGPIGEFLVTRSKTVESAIGDAEAASRSASAELVEWKKSWESSEAHVKAQLDEAKVAMERLRETTLKAAKVEADRIRKESELVGKSEVMKAKESLRREVAEKSVKLAEAYLAGHLGDKDQQKLVSEYVEIVGNGSV